MNSALPQGNNPEQLGPGGTGTDNPFQQKYKFSPEERRVLRDCNRESFWYRSVPIGGFLSSVAYAGVKYGVLNPNARFGPAPKMFGAALVGYFIGKISYQRTCAEKIMQLPNSQLGEYLRKQRGTGGMGGFQEALTLESDSFAAPAGAGGSFALDRDPTTAQGQTSSDISDMRAMNSFDNESSQFYSNVDIGKPVDEQMMNDDNLPPQSRPQHSTTYDDLRRQNRVEYEMQRHQPPPSPPLSAEQPRRLAPVPPAGSRESQGLKKSKNIYGDVWEDTP